MDPCETYRPLMVGLLDNELSPTEKQEINTHLLRCESCRKEFDEMREMAGKLSVPPFKEVEDKVLDRLWNSPHSRLVRHGGIVMLIGGYLSLVLYGLYEFFTAKDEAAFPKVAIAAMLIGLIITFGTVLLTRLKTYKHDRYKEIER